MNVAFQKTDAPLENSGIDWLGEIPADWKTIKLKFVTKIRKRIAGYEGPDVLSITQQGIKVKDIESGEGQLAQNYSGYQLVYKGDFAMNHMDLLTGYVDISKFDGVVSPDYRVFTNESDEIVDEFLLLIFQIGYRQRIFFRYGQGVSLLGRWRFPAENFNEFVIPIPPLNVQKCIVEFLNDKTAKIDRAVKIKEGQIALLRERKQIIIQEAVARGLNPNAPMKDSGIDWIGHIPAHWEVLPLRYLSKTHSGYGFPVELQGDDTGTVPFMKVSDFSSSQRTIECANNYVSERTIARRGWKKVPAGCLVTAKIGEALRKNHRNLLGRDAVIDNNCIGFEPNGVEAGFFYYLHSVVDFDWFVNPGAVPSMSVQKYRSLPVALPPNKEQLEISAHIDAEAKKIDEAVQLKQRQIEALKEYKATLINAAVTGKIKVI